MWSPLNLPSLYAWYDASQLALSDTDPVASWTDLSGNGRHATQGTAGSRPQYRTSPHRVVFDGSSDFLEYSFAAMSGAFTVIAVGTRSSGNFWIPLANQTNSMFMGISTDNNCYLQDDAGDWDPPLSVTSFTAGVARFYRASGGASTYAKFSGVTVGDLGTKGTYTPTRLGARTEFTNGTMNEVIICTADLAAGDVTALGSYVLAKWGYNL